MRQKLITLILIFGPLFIHAQIFNHWSHNFSEESSLAAGAVVGGGAGTSAIFYNPASISEINESKLSVNMNLYTYDYLKYKNALGDGNDMYSSRLYMIPRSVSFMMKFPRHPEWNIEIAYLNVANFYAESMSNTDVNIDILTHLPGLERYTTYSYLRTEFRNDFLGFGGSRKINDHFYFGTSLFISFKSLYSAYVANLNAYPVDPVIINGNQIPFFTATYKENELVKFNDYRVLMKFGLLYKKSGFSVGINVTTPSVGGIYSDGKRLRRERSQSNITNPATGLPLEDYILTDYAETKEVKVNSKTPLSIAAGCTLYNADKKRHLFTTIEYFAPVEPYRMVQATENPDLAGGSATENVDGDEWLNFVDGAKPVLNVALGIRGYIKENLMFMGGFKTNFSYKNHLDIYPFQQDKMVKSVDLDYYHLSGGLTLRIFGQDLTAGLQYKLGINKNQTQFINVTEPVEFNTTEMKALQGTRKDNMNSVLNSMSILFSATFNFSKISKK